MGIEHGLVRYCALGRTRQPQHGTISSNAGTDEFGGACMILTNTRGGRVPQENAYDDPVIEGL